MEIRDKVWMSMGMMVSAVSLHAVADNVVVSEKRVRDERPNIVWFLAEDLSSQYLALFNDGKGAVTPNLERLSRGGLIYTNACPYYFDYRMLCSAFCREPAPETARNADA